MLTNSITLNLYLPNYLMSSKFFALMYRINHPD